MHDWIQSIWSYEFWKGEFRSFESLKINNKEPKTKFKARYEDCGNTEDEFVDKIMAAWLAAQAAQEEQGQSRKRRAKGGQGGKRGRGKGNYFDFCKTLNYRFNLQGGKNRKPKEIKIPTEFRRYNKSDPMQVPGFNKSHKQLLAAV